MSEGTDPENRFKSRKKDVKCDKETRTEGRVPSNRLAASDKEDKRESELISEFQPKGSQDQRNNLTILSLAEVRS
jgi:hypothetical protein